MLNSAAGFIFPSPIAPPMKVIPLIFSLMSGKALIRRAKLVMAPVTTNSIGSSSAMILLQICRKGFLVTAELGDFSNSVPSSPVFPWISGAVFRFLQRGPQAPLTTSMSDLPISQRMSSAFWVVFQITEFPAEVDTPNRSIQSVIAAMMMASISSCPGSQSSQTFIFYSC